MDKFRLQEKAGLPFNPIKCSWSDVMLQLGMATQAAASSEQGDKHWLTGRRRKLARMTRMIEPLLEALPDDLCYLHGALALVFYVSTITLSRF